MEFLHISNIFESIDRIDLKVFPRYTGCDNEDDGYNDVKMNRCFINYSALEDT